MIVSGMLVLGVFLLAMSAVAFNVGNTVVTNPTQDQVNNNANLRNVWSPMLWNFGMFFLLVAVFGAAAMFEHIDPLARLLLWIVTLVAALLILTGGVTLFK